MHFMLNTHVDGMLWVSRALRASTSGKTMKLQIVASNQAVALPVLFPDTTTKMAAFSNFCSCPKLTIRQGCPFHAPAAQVCEYGNDTPWTSPQAFFFVSSWQNHLQTPEVIFNTLTPFKQGLSQSMFSSISLLLMLFIRLSGTGTNTFAFRRHALFNLVHFQQTAVWRWSDTNQNVCRHTVFLPACFYFVHLILYTLTAQHFTLFILTAGFHT